MDVPVEPVLFIPGDDFKSFEWSTHEEEARRTRLDQNAFAYSGQLEELVALYDSMPNAVTRRIEVVGVGELPTLEEAMAFAETYDRIDATSLYAAANGKSTSEVSKRRRSGQKWPFDEFRDNKYRLWAIWLVHVLIHSDSGQRYGNLFAVYSYFRTYHEDDVFPAHASTLCLFQPRALLRRCPGCGLAPCMNMDDDGRILDYSMSEDCNKYGEGPAMRYRAYSIYAQCYKLKQRQMLEDCACFVIKLLYPGGELTGFEEAVSEESEDSDSE